MMSVLLVFLVLPAFVCVLLLSLLIGYVLYIHYVHIKYSHIPSEKRSSFFYGHLPAIHKTVAEGQLMEDLFLEWSNEYGPVFVVYILHMAFVQVYIPEVIRETLVVGNYPKPVRSYKPLEELFGQRFMGRGLVTETNHELWKPMSSLFSPTFHRNFLKTCIVQFNASCDQLVKVLGSKADGKTEVKMLDMFSKVSLDCISKVAFGFDPCVFDEQADNQLIIDLKTVCYSILAHFQQPFLWCSPLKSAFEQRRKARKAAKNIREIGRQCIIDKKEALKRGEELDNNILAHILKLEGSSVDDGVIDTAQMIDHFVTFFAAGQETTACLMASTLMELVQHPEIAYKMKTEVDAVIGDDGYVSFEDLSKLKYTNAVLKESLRVHPPVTAVIRCLPHDVTWNGLKIPSSTTIVAPIMNMGRKKEHFENPKEFMPSRFLGDESYSNVYLPFSLGPRKCIGQQFAMIEARVIMAKLMKLFTFDLVPGQSMQYVKAVTVKPQDGCLVYIKPVVRA